MSSSGLTRGSLWNSKFIYNEIPRSSRGMTQGLVILEFPKIRHCGNFVIASKAKQSLGILDFYPRNSKFIMMRSPIKLGDDTRLREF